MSESICHFEVPLRTDKNLVFKGNKYPIDFNILSRFSDYFYKNQREFENMENIELYISPDIPEEAFMNFILCCQNSKFAINNSIIFPLYQLSIQYEVAYLLTETQNYIRKNHKELVFHLISFKNQLKSENVELSQKIESIEGSQIEEDIISSHFFEYTNDIRLVQLPIPILFRIIKKSDLSFDSMSEEIQMNFFDFLFKCLDEHGKQASTLFSDIDFSKVKIDVFSRLQNDYSEKFDFKMIDSKSLFIICMRQAKELNELKDEIEKERIEHSQRELKSRVAPTSEIKEPKNKTNQQDPKFDIFVKFLDGRTLIVNVSPNEKIGDFVNRIKSQNGLSGDYTTVFNGKVLMSNITFGDYRISPHSTIFLILALRG